MGVRDMVGFLDPGRYGPDRRLGMRMLLAVAAFAVAAVPFGLVLLLVEAHWPPALRLDRDTAEDLHQQALAHPALVSVLRVLTDMVWDPVTMRLLTVLLVVWLLFRRAWRLAAWAAVTVAASGLVGLLVKTVVARTRPSLPDPVAHAPGFSFPSGHAMTAATCCPVLLLVLLPMVPRRWRPLPWALAVVSVVGVGYTRVALGVHWLSDVVGGWLLGLAVVAATTAAFEAWRTDVGRRRTAPTEGIAPEVRSSDPEPPVGDCPGPRDARRVAG
ncbi:phosphatase PAP2 family protein [Streptacidiphilus sp. ASG 303]|uniref:phosphatase PAP2 family protein n=1 Tax=Streptacidiphilus sp. ASG 303 TaxID=2896847 RepID=UPI001E31790B|nr:phosphatase PAP2 family protein [Streptacidiphilus sp. ASG 303]MCD0481362.1 phosphatase PAP2 family protein [Streptacidiphilus sp. ASG 303]